MRSDVDHRASTSEDPVHLLALELISKSKTQTPWLAHTHAYYDVPHETCNTCEDDEKVIPSPKTVPYTDPYPKTQGDDSNSLHMISKSVYTIECVLSMCTYQEGNTNSKYCCRPVDVG